MGGETEKIKRIYRIDRAYKEAIHAAIYFGVKKVKLDPDDGRWVEFRDFPLPSGYNRTVTDLLIILPEDYPRVPPDWFYLDRGLQRAKDGAPIDHYFEQHYSIPSRSQGVGDPVKKGWAGGCLHITSWRPAAQFLMGDNLLSVCILIWQALRRWAA